MPKITFEMADGSFQEVDGRPGLSLMEVAKRWHIRGIAAECGGACSCATCHVIVDPSWTTVVGPPGEDERQILEFVSGATGLSRLSCQIRIDNRLEGLRIRVPRA